MAASATGFVLPAAIAPSLANAGTRQTHLSASDFGARGNGRQDDTEALQAALAALAQARTAGILHIAPGEYRITRPLRLDMTRARVDGVWGISAYGARLRSAIRDGGDMLTITSTAVSRFFLIEGLSLRGSGADGHGLSIICDGQGHYLYNAALRDFTVEGCGADGCRILGNVFESQIVNAYFRDNGANGLTLGHGKRGGILSAMHVFGSVFGGNGRHGAALIRRANDVSFTGCYFLENARFGLVASNGCALLAHCGFENNHDSAGTFARGKAGLRLNVAGTLIGCTGYSIRNQTRLVSGYVTNRLVMIGCTGRGDERAKSAGLAAFKGNGNGDITLIGSSGRMIAGDGVAVTEIGQGGAGARFGDRWDSGNPLRLGEHTLWIDGDGALRVKKGRPKSDKDGNRT